MGKSVNIEILILSDTPSPKQGISGRALVNIVTKEGHSVVERLLIPDDIGRIRYEMSRRIQDPGIEVVISIGGTRLSDRDGTSEALLPLFDRVVDSFSAVFHEISFGMVVASTIASRAVADVAYGAFIFCLSGVMEACKDVGNDILPHQLDDPHRPCNLVELMPGLNEPLVHP